MKGDFTRNTFDPGNHFTRVLMQQGRVQLDADWNEQVAILLHYLQTLATDLIGPHGGPSSYWGFEIKTIPENSTTINDLKIGIGRYYVNGILCENEGKVDETGDKTEFTYYDQPYYPLDSEQDELPVPPFLVYLDVWERHITAIEAPKIREVALGNPDTATRAKVVWQVKTQQLESVVSCADLAWNDLVEEWQPANRGQLKAQANISANINLSDPCITSPQARYRGAENQLYRVEIHKGGVAKDATFKWSRDNGAVVFPIDGIATNSTADTKTTTVKLKHLGRDDHRFGLKEGHWVEIVDDDYILQNRAEVLLQVESINRVDREVILNGISSIVAAPAKHPLLRRWDHEGDPEHHGTLPIVEPETSEGSWIHLEDGIRIQFQKSTPDNQYRTGDYWLIPARTATGDVEWPREKDNEGHLKKDEKGQPIPEALPPHGVEHHYAPLAIVSVDGDGKVVIAEGNDCRRPFNDMYELKQPSN